METHGHQHLTFLKSVNSYMDYSKAKNQSGGSTDRLKFIIVVRGPLHNKELFGYNWSPTAYTRNLKDSFADAVKYKARVDQLYCIVSLMQ